MRSEALLEKLRAAARRQVAGYPQYEGGLAEAVLCTVRDRVDAGPRHVFNAGETTICSRETSEGRLSVWSFKIGGWVALRPEEVRLGVSGARRSPRYKQDPPKIPTIDECVRRRTHMLRSTGDGHCKVCFDRSDLDEFNLLVVNAATGAATPLRVRRRVK